MTYKYGLVTTRKDVEKLPVPKADSADPDVPKAPYHAKCGTLPGLTCAVSCSGQRTFHLWFRTRSGAPRRMWLGRYPIMGPAEAYSAALPILARRDAGFDPAAELQQKFHMERQDRSETLAALAPRFFADKLDLRSHADLERCFNVAIVPNLPKLPARQIERRHVAEMVDRVRDQSGPAAARKALAWASTFFTWLDEKGILNGPSPCRLVKAPAAIEGDRVFSNAEIAVYWRAASRLPLLYSTYLRVLLLTGQRLREVAGMRWSELSLASAEWLIPASRMKAKREHLVPLPPTAVKLIDAMPRLGECVFTTSGSGPIAGFAWIKRQLVAEMTKLDPELMVKAEDFGFHTARRTMKTGMSRLKVHPWVSERCLAHSPAGKLERVYDKHQFADEKRDAWERWDAEVNRIAGPQLTVLAATGTE